MRLKDKVALVTGASPNIGGGIAEGLAAEGAAISSASTDSNIRTSPQTVNSWYCPVQPRNSQYQSPARQLDPCATPISASFM